MDAQNTPTIASSPYTDEAFDVGLIRITYRQGVYFMKSNGTTNIYRRFIPQEKFNAYPGHRICLGDNILYLLQHINFSIGEQYSVLVKEYSSISEITNVSIYALIEQVGEEPSCKDYVYQHLHDKLAGAAK